MSYNSPHQAFFGSVSHVTATLSHGVEVGTRRWVGGREYVLVYNDGGSNIPPGYGCVTNDGASSIHSVTVSSTTGVGLAIGVAYHDTLTTGTYGWVVVRGVVPCEMSATVATNGAVELGDLGLWFPVSDATGLRGPTQGIAMDTIATAASGDVAVFCAG